jgi:hypothetical protein
MADTGWFKSTYSAAASEDCVEVRITERSVGVRDSKNVAGPAIDVPVGAWAEFLSEWADRSR